ncbi:MAG: amphi-Trp domain-containing protein [Deltaproteobacteria bacterium]|nr:amphi-Trp domain-containing protein [Deltaproteobacteria bacterium]
MEKKKLSLKKFMTPTEAATKLEDLARAFRSGLITVEKGSESLLMSLADTIEVEITAKEKKKKFNFALELSWCSETEEDDDNDIVISENLNVATEEDENSIIEPNECVKVETVTTPGIFPETENSEEFKKDNVAERITAAANAKAKIA